MKEDSKKTVNVLGIDVSVMRPEKAVNITLNYINRKEMSTIFFHTAASSLFCETREDAGAWLMESCDLVLPGDRSMEKALKHVSFQSNEALGNSLFADTYLRKLFGRLNKDSREIFVVMSKEEHFLALKEYMQSSFPQIDVDGAIFDENAAGDAERIVNEINGKIPSIVFICLPADLQITLTKEYELMMNTHLIICIESLQPLVLKETETIPQWIQDLHLTRFYKWVKRENKIQEQIMDSLFKQSVLDDSGKDETGDQRLDSDNKDSDNKTKQDGEE